MKKILTLVILIGVFATSLVSCKLFEPVTQKEETAAAETAEPVDYDEIKDRDENGKFILTSTENRPVYRHSEGYAVFKYIKGSAYKIYYVLSFDDKAAADEYLSEKVAINMESGEYSNVVSEDNLVIYTVSINHKTLGKYFTMTQSEAEKDFVGLEVKE